MAISIVRFGGIATRAMITKTLKRQTSSLPNGVKGIVRARGFLTSTQILKLFPTRYFLTDENGDYITDEDGNQIEVLV